MLQPKQRPRQPGAQLSFVEKELKIRMELQRLQIYMERAVGIAETKSLRAADDDLNNKLSCNESW